MVALFFIGVLVVLASLIAMLALAKKGKKGGGFICLGGMALGIFVVALSCVASVPTSSRFTGTIAPTSRGCTPARSSPGSTTVSRRS